VKCFSRKLQFTLDGGRTWVSTFRALRRPITRRRGGVLSQIETQSPRGRIKEIDMANPSPYDQASYVSVPAYRRGFQTVPKVIGSEPDP
jgi:hypothetical protein